MHYFQFHKHILKWFLELSFSTSLSDYPFLTLLSGLNLKYTSSNISGLSSLVWISLSRLHHLYLFPVFILIVLNFV